MTKFQTPIYIFIFCIGLFACNSEKKQQTNDTGIVMSLVTLQTSVLDEYNSSQSKLFALRELAADKSNPLSSTKALKVLLAIEKIDKHAEDLIAHIERIKKQLFTELGENINPSDKNSIVSSPYNLREPLSIGTYALFEVKSTATTSLLDYAGNTSKELIADIQSFRKVLCEEFILSHSMDGEAPFYFKDPAINEYKDFTDLQNQFEKALNKSNIHNDDFDVLQLLYAKLSVSNYHWSTVMKSDISWMSVFGVLTSIEYKILEARTNALENIASRFSLGSEFTISSLEPVVFGPEIAYEGETVEMEVALAGYDENNQPMVTVSGGSIKETKNGKGYVTTKAPTGVKEMTIGGTISILSRSGDLKFFPWTKTIVILKHDAVYNQIHGLK